jgi:putative ABC transport system permease protein
MSTALRRRAIEARAGNGGLAARRAVIRWAWRLTRREWRQQILVVALLAVAVAATIFAAAVAYNAPSTADAATFGGANEVLTLPGNDPHLAADIAAVRHRFGPVDVIEDENLATGTVQTVELRAQDPYGRYGQPMLSLLSGHYPTRPDEVAVTRDVASLFNLRIGGLWHQGGRARRVTGLVENPANLLDQFALVIPGQIRTASQVTILFDASAASVAGWRLPAGATPRRRMSAQPDNGVGPTAVVHRISRTDVVVVAAVLGMIFIGLVAVAGFTVMAQRRLRSLGMLGALGATDRNIRLVMVASGALVGVVGALIGTAVGLAAWSAYAPSLQASVEHRVEWSNLPWWAIATAIVLAILTAVAAASRPAGAAARIPAVSALSGRPGSPTASHRSAVPGVILVAAGLGCLASEGGWARAWATGGNPATSGTDTLLLVAGIVATAVGALLLAPLAIALPAIAARRAPIALRIAVRDLARYRARSGAALAAISFAVLLAVLICILATARFSDPLTYRGPNLIANQLIVYQPHGPGSGYPGSDRPTPPLALRALQTSVHALAASLHARFVLPLDSAGRPDPAPDATNQRATLWQAVSEGTVMRAEALREDSTNYHGPLYVATDALLRDFGIKPNQINPDTDVLTARRGLASVSHLELLGQGDIVGDYTPDGHMLSESHRCPPKTCIADPKIQTLTKLPAGTSAPNTLITERSLRALGQQLVPDGWLIQTTAPLTPAQKDAARRLALAAETRVETSSGGPDAAKIRDWATAVGIILALGVLAMTVGLIRSETTSNLRTLTATGASNTTRRTLAGATAGVLGLLGALLGTAVAYLAVIAWAHGTLGTMLSPVPTADLIAILVGLPLVATTGSWLLAGRQPPVISRQPLE